MEIKRDAYLQQLTLRKDNGMIKVITGIRRCGKSFLLFTIFKRYLLENGVDVDHIIEIALDGIENEELRDPKVCFKYIKDAMKDDGKYYLLLDEVQFMSQFEEVLNSLLRMSNIDVYVTGSNSKFLSSDIVTEFRGRGDEIRIYPLSFAEFYSVYDGDYDDAWDDYMIYGGLPQIVSFQSERQKADYLKNIFANVYLKDVIERNKIQNVDEIGILVDVLASAIGAPTNPSKIANTFASERQMTYANKTISKHIDYLTDGTLFLLYGRKDFENMTHRRYEYIKGLNGHSEIALYVDTFEEVDMAYNNAIKNGATSVLEPELEPWGQRTCYIADPEGNLIEIGSWNKVYEQKDL